jgi:hypothetical protein
MQKFGHSVFLKAAEIRVPFVRLSRPDSRKLSARPTRRIRASGPVGDSRLLWVCPPSFASSLEIYRQC